jgi:SAM-dependent methyltransferase
MPTTRSVGDGSLGWDDYAPFYDWENARTMGREDVPFWTRLVRQTGGPVLELGCGTGRVLVPVARTGVALVGVDRSAPMLARARRRIRRLGGTSRVTLVRGDIRTLPFARPGSFALVIAPYGILQSLTREADLRATLESVAQVVRPGGTFALDLVPDLPAWKEYRRRLSLRGPRGSGQAQASHLSLIESVRQDPKRKLTIFDQEYIERRDGRITRHTFSLTFRTLSVPQMVRRVERAGFRIEAILGDYEGRPWDPRAEVWVMIAKKK